MKKPSCEVEKYIRENYYYNEFTGVLNKHGLEKIGSINTQGYRVISIKSVQFKSHNVIWFLHTGSWPKGVIDHINRVRNDNRIENLRDVTKSINSRNSPTVNIDFIHTTKSKCGKRWVSRVGRKYPLKGSIYLGTYETREMATLVAMSVENGEIEIDELMANYRLYGCIVLNKKLNKYYVKVSSNGKYATAGFFKCKHEAAMVKFMILNNELTIDEARRKTGYKPKKIFCRRENMQPDD